jgi:hypothetical protein
MDRGGFDATITLNVRRLAVAELSNRPTAAVAAVREAVERMEGARQIDVGVQAGAQQLEWMAVYPPGGCTTPDTPAWRDRLRQVKSVVTAALKTAGRHPAAG